MKKSEYQHLNHDCIKPFYQQDSRILILGSFPSIKSRAEKFYYAHKTNRFFPILASLFDEETPETTDERKAFLAKHHIALFDVIKECDIKASSDSTIKNPIPNDLKHILKNSDIKAIFATGRKAYELYLKLIGDDAIYLPSPSAANAASKFEDLVASYRIILSFLAD